jgi:GNAT superfamily N-acetyltransferase
MTIRDLELERDAPEVVELIRETWPTTVVNVSALVHRVRTVPQRSLPRVFVAEVDERVVGWSQSRLENFFSNDTDTGFIAVQVRADHRGNGIGARLYEQALEHADEIGAVRLLSMFYENEAGVRFANARDFVEERGEQESVLDPRRVRDEPPADVDLRPVADVDPHLVHAVDEAATRDMPASEELEAIPYEEWVAHVLDHPLFTADGSFVAMADGVAAAVSLLLADPATGRATNMFTGTLREYRGLGLARAAKLVSIRWAAANGVTSMVTTNDETNAPMLAINRRLGFVPSGRRVEYVKELG